MNSTPLRPRHALLVLGFVLSLASLPAQVVPPPPASATPPPPPPASTPDGYGLPLNGLTAAESAAFLAGQRDFLVIEVPETGLGPIFNDNSCVACHHAPAAGGGGNKTVTRFGHTVNGVFDPLTAEGGTLLHSRATARPLLEVVPADANVTIQRLTTPLFGAGLIEAIPDAAIVANAATAKPAGIKGRVAYVTDVATGLTRVGRFGWKNQHATLLSFNADALNNEVGITNRLFPKAAAPNGNEALLARYVSPTAPIEDQPDPVTGQAELDLLTAYTRFLAPPPGTPSTPNAVAGQKLFTSVGCAACHTPALSTGPNASTALANKTVRLYSDLLLHDMGTLGDGIAQAAATTTELRTAPLWGLNARHTFLHDGRAATPADAILGHAGEAANVITTYNKLTPAQQQQLLAFLKTL